MAEYHRVEILIIDEATSAMDLSVVARSASLGWERYIWRGKLRPALGEAWVVRDHRGILIATDEDPRGWCNAPVLDALGKPVPEWAKEAFAILSADGRRVAVGEWPVSHGLGSRDSDAYIDHAWIGTWGVMKGGPWFAKDHDGTSASAASAARRALAMEAERKGPARGIAYPDQSTLTVNTEPLRLSSESVQRIVAAVQGVADAASQVAARFHETAEAFCESLAAVPAKAEHVPPTGPRCLRCGGPAYHGLFSATCLREGGCRTLDERIGEPVIADEPAYLDEEPRDADIEAVVYGYGGSAHSEPKYMLASDLAAYRASNRPLSHKLRLYTRDLAVAAWREAMRERERGK